MKVQANYVIKDESMPAGADKPKNNTLPVQAGYSSHFAEQEAA